MFASIVGLPQCLVARIQCCQNIAAHTVTRQKKTCHTTPILKEFHALASCEIRDTVQSAAPCIPPNYLVITREPRPHPLRFADAMLLTVPQTEDC